MKTFSAYNAICNEIDSLTQEEFKDFVYGFMRDSVFDVIDMMDLSDITTEEEARQWVKVHMH